MPGLGRRAADINTRAADKSPFDDGGPATSVAQVEGEWFSRLPRINNNCTKAI